MRDWILDYIRCPHCFSELECHTFEVDNNQHIVAGVLIPKNPQCSLWYPIIRGVPRLLPVSLRETLTRDFIQTYQTQLRQLALIHPQDQVSKDDLHNLKLHTIQNFGFEWTEFARYGWDDPQYNIAHEEKIFLKKSLLNPDEITGKLVLDAGCGNGRYSYWVARYGGQVIGMDLGDGVDAAFANTKDLSNVAIVQGDIFNPPFTDKTFDVIFSIGVLMHTGDAERATKSLAKKVKTGGSLTAHLYGRGNPIYEVVDGTLRHYTTRLSIQKLQSFTRRAFALRRLLERLKFVYITDLFIRLDPHPHCIFDWYAAPIATHHTLKQVSDWFHDLKMPIVMTNEDGPPRVSGGIRGVLRDWHRKLRPGTVTVKGIRQSE